MLKVDLTQKKSQLCIYKLQNRGCECSQVTCSDISVIFLIIIANSSSVSISITRDC